MALGDGGDARPAKEESSPDEEQEAAEMQKHDVKTSGAQCYGSKSVEVVELTI